MSDLLGIGASGVRAYQNALSVVSDNIANATTTGYVRRNATLIESPVSSSTMITQLPRSDVGGVQVGAIARSWDQFKANDVRTANADVARSESGITWMERVESGLSANGLGTNLTGFFNANTALAADPGSTAARTDFLAKADATATAFRGTAATLDALGTELNAQANLSVDTLNGLSAGLAKVNQSLDRATAGTSAQAALLDQRDTILDQMSSLTAISVDIGKTGAATVRLNQAGGPAIVDGINATNLGVTTNASGAVAFTLDPYGKATAVGINGGALAGLADASARIADSSTRIDSLAKDFGSQVNAVQAGGVDLDGKSGAALFTFDADNPAATIAVTPMTERGIAAAAPFTAAAANNNAGTGVATLTIDPSASSLPARDSYSFKVSGSTVTISDTATGQVLGTTPYVAGQPISGAGFTVSLSGTPSSGDSFIVAATKTDSRDNGNLTALADLRTSGSYEGKLDTLVSSNGSALESRRVLAATQGAIRDNATTARDSVSAVNLDNEAVDLMRFQQAYQASSRIVQVAREVFQTLLDAS